MFQRDPTLLPASKTVPLFPGRPLIGSMLEFRRDRLSLYDRVAKQGGLMRIAFGPMTLHIVTDAELAHHILSDDAASYKKARTLSEFLRPLLGGGLLTAEAEVHRRHRKLLAPAFAPKRMNKYATKRTAQGWSNRAPGTSETIDLAEAMMEMTLAIAGKTLVGQDLRQQAHEVGDALTMAMESLITIVTSFVRIPYHWPAPRHQNMRKAVATLDRVVYGMIAKRRGEGDTDRGDVLSMLLSARDEQDGTVFSDKQIRDEVMTLLLAGHETTANALTWTLFELGKHPEIVSRLLTEIDTIVGQRDATPEDLEHLPMLLAVIEESMRLHPPAYVVGREVVKETTLGGHHMPVGATALVNIMGIHRRADYYSQPDLFRPERMLASEKKTRPRHHYLPFGSGPRVCIGSHFALLEAQLCLLTLLQHASIETLVKERQPEALVTLRPKDGLPCQVGPRIAKAFI
jgi:cytochrome P450